MTNISTSLYFEAKGLKYDLWKTSTNSIFWKHNSDLPFGSKTHHKKWVEYIKMNFKFRDKSLPLTNDAWVKNALEKRK